MPAVRQPRGNGQGGRVATSRRGTVRQGSKGGPGGSGSAAGLTAVLRWWRRLDGRGRGAFCAVLVVIVGAAVALLVTSGGGPAPRARQYLAFTACLLTDSRGLAGPQAAAAWAGMQDASLATHAKVQSLAVPPGSSSAAPYLASLVLRKCAVVVATGPAQVAAVAADAGHFRSVHFCVVGGGASGPNVTVLRGSAGAVKSAVAALVTSAVAASG
jgi:hypothetical protein